MSNISKFYSHKNILVTGCTGFLGTAVVEKILRSFPDIGNLYLMNRSKSGVDFQRRCEQYFQAPVFAPMIERNPDYFNKVKWIQCDLSEGTVNLNAEDLRAIREVEIVLHVASTMNFQSSLHDLLLANLYGTKVLLDIFKSSEKPVCFMFVSSAYLNARKRSKKVEERLYKAIYEPGYLLDLVKSNHKELLSIEEEVMMDWPNGYVFTKTVIESLCKDYAKNFPIGILRPGNITASYLEPYPYFNKSKAGVMGIIYMMSLNLMTSIYLKKNVNSHSVPVDYTANALLASAYQVATNREADCKVYNYTSSHNPITIYDTIVYALGDHVKEVFTESYDQYKHKNDTATIVKAYQLDLKLIRTANKPKYLDLHKQCSKFVEVMRYYSGNNIDIENQNINDLWDSLNKVDKELLKFDLNAIDWKDYFKNVISGLREH